MRHSFYENQCHAYQPFSCLSTGMLAPRQRNPYGAYFDTVYDGKLLHETSYPQRAEKHNELEISANYEGIELAGKIDFYDAKNRIIHETKRSDKAEEAHQWQVKFYIWLLELNGIIIATAILEYPKLRQTDEVFLTNFDKLYLQKITVEIPKICDSEFCPPVINSKICKSCSYYELCLYFRMKKSYYLFNAGRMSRKDNTLKFIPVDESGNEGAPKYIPVEGVDNLYCFGALDANSALYNFLGKNQISVHFFDYYEHYTGSFFPKEYLLSGRVIIQQTTHYRKK